MTRIGFRINPIAGMGDRVGLKGADGVVQKAMELGAQPTAHLKAGEALAALSRPFNDPLTRPVHDGGPLTTTRHVRRRR